MTETPPTPPRPWQAHPTAAIDEPCTIGEGTRIWHFCHVMAGAVIGRDCTMGQNVFVADGVRIGDGCKIQNNVSLYSGVTLGDHVFCGPSVVFTNVRHPRADISRRGEYETTIVGEGATLGANSTIVCGARIGRHAFIAAGAVVTGAVADYALVAGVPARQIGWSGRAGYRLEPDPGRHGHFTCPATGEHYLLDHDNHLRTEEPS